MTAEAGSCHQHEGCTSEWCARSWTLDARNPLQAGGAASKEPNRRVDLVFVVGGTLADSRLILKTPAPVPNASQTPISDHWGVEVDLVTRQREAPGPR